MPPAAAEWINSVGAMIGGIAAAVSVWYAAWQYRLSEERKLIDGLRVVAVQVKASVRNIDRAIGYALFLDISERFKEKIKPFVKQTETKEEFFEQIASKNVRPKLGRAAIMAVHESTIYEKVNDQLDSINVTCIQLAQRFPVTSHAIRMCSDMVANVLAHAIKQSRDFSFVFDNDEAKGPFYSLFVDADHFDEYMHVLASYVSNMPMTYISQRGQKIIDPSVEIVEILTESLADKDFAQLRKQERFERNISREVVDATETVTGDISVCIQALRPYFAEKAWDALLTAHTKLDQASA